jgi:hypothetical protein
MNNSLNPQKKDNPIYSMTDGFAKKMNEEEPIRRGCTNGQCFCSGACQEIIGWRKKDNHPFSLSPTEWLEQIQQTTDEKSHFEDIEQVKLCKNPEHNPPTHLHIPQGKRYVHICPGCNSRVILQPPQITC